MQEEHPTHGDIHYRLGQVSEKCESLQVSVKALAHSDERLTCVIAANHKELGDKLSGVNDKVVMLFTGVLIAAFTIPLVVPIATHIIDDLWAQKSQPAPKP